MAFIVSRRSHNSRGFYLVESRRDQQGRPRLHTLCYLGREQDGTDTLDKAIVHWEVVRQGCLTELKTTKGERSGVLRRRKQSAESKLTLLKARLEEDASKRVEQLRRVLERERREEETGLWQAFDTLRQQPSDTNAQAARRAFLTLAKRLHPDQGGDHQAFLRLKNTYDVAKARWETRRVS